VSVDFKVAGEAIAQGAPALADRISYSFNRVSEACRRHSPFSNTIIYALHSKGDRPLVSVDFKAQQQEIARLVQLQLKGIVPLFPSTNYSAPEEVFNVSV
jgi:hypothetical protein